VTGHVVHQYEMGVPLVWLDLFVVLNEAQQKELYDVLVVCPFHELEEYDAIA
jgi:hypothetical protein